jgi:hypothetical protein
MKHKSTKAIIYAVLILIMAVAYLSYSSQYHIGRPSSDKAIGVEAND